MASLAGQFYAFDGGLQIAGARNFDSSSMFAAGEREIRDVNDSRVVYFNFH